MSVERSFSWFKKQPWSNYLLAEGQICVWIQVTGAPVVAVAITELTAGRYSAGRAAERGTSERESAKGYAQTPGNSDTY